MLESILALWLLAAKRNVGDAAPPLPAKDLDGAPLSWKELRGRPVVVDFWATWCAPCRAQVPGFVALQKKFPRAVVLGISLDDDPAAVREFRKKYGVTYRLATGDAKLAGEWGGILGLPVAFVVDAGGRLVARHDGEGDLAAIEKDLAKMAGGK